MNSKTKGRGEKFMLKISCEYSNYAYFECEAAIPKSLKTLIL